MSDYTAKGSIEVIEDTVTIGENNFRKREFVIEVPGTYPEHIKFELIKDKCELMDQFTAGQEVEVSFNLKGRQAKNGSFYNNLQAWKVQAVGQAAPLPPTADPMAKAPAAKLDDIDDDLPF